MIRVLFGAGSAAAANGMTADVDILLDAGAAGSAGDDFTINLTLDEGAATGEGFSAGLDESVALSIAGGEVAAGVEIAGADETVSVAFSGGQAPATGLNTNISVLWVPGEAEGGSSITLPAIGDAFEGGFYAGLISHTANGVATHALIVAPRATGATGTGYTLTSNLQQKTVNSSTSNTDSPFDGAANTAAMVTAGIASHPAANFCVGLSIGGFSDWYLPARFELDIAYENLKPDTTANNTLWGINDYSVPKRTANRTSGDPARTSVLAFRTGGAEAFEATEHWQSQEDPASGGSQAWAVRFSFGDHTNDFGNTSSKSLFRRVRAFRKIAL
jgi:hypothetical protein